MVDKVTERTFSQIEFMRLIASSFDNNVIGASTGNEELISGGIPMTTLGEKAKILGGIRLVTSGLASSSDLLEQENMQLRNENLTLIDTIRKIEKRLTSIEAYLPKEKVVVLREVSREEAENEIKSLFLTGKTLYYSDIAQELGLDLKLVVDICNELQKRGEITIDAGVS